MYNISMKRLDGNNNERIKLKLLADGVITNEISSGFVGCKWNIYAVGLIDI